MRHKVILASTLPLWFRNDRNDHKVIPTGAVRGRTPKLQIMETIGFYEDRLCPNRKETDTVVDYFQYSRARDAVSPVLFIDRK